MLQHIFGPGVTMAAIGPWVRWNLFLAIIPVVLAYFFAWLINSRRASGSWSGRILAALIFGLWLAFVPNTCYLLTEWRHFLNAVANPSFLTQAGTHRKLVVSAQGIFYMVYSGLGLLLFTLAIRPVERIFRSWRVPFTVVAVPLFLMIAVGVYLGLERRLNSWNIINHPRIVWNDAIQVLNNYVLLMALLLFGFFLWALYEAVDLWMDGIADRWLAIRQRFGGHSSGKRRRV